MQEKNISTNPEGGSAQTDLRLVSKISAGDSEAWESFVARFTGWSIYRSHKWCQTHCPHHAADIGCGLKSVTRSLLGRNFFSRREECDEGMEIYIWILEQLKKKITRYKAKNNSRLSTYVWAVLNSKEFYVDWLRHKYGRVF